MMEVEGKINKQEVEDILPLTPMQESMLFQYLKKPGSQLYFEQICYGLTGDVRVETVKEAWNFVAEANEMLRTVFRWQGLKKPLQIILKNRPVSFKGMDLSQLNDEAQQQLIRIKDQDRQKGTDLSVEPFRVTLCKMAEKRYEMIVSNHHIIYDGWSNVILLKEFLEVYHDIYYGTQPILPVKNRYKEYIKWQQQQDKIKQKNYWKKSLGGFKGRASFLPTKKGGGIASQEKYYEYPLPGELIKEIRKFSKNNGTTAAVVLYSAWAMLLHKYSNAEDVIFGITVSGRNPQIKVIQNMVGLFINTLPFRLRINPEEKVDNFLRDANAKVMEIEEFESTPLIDVISYSERDPREALFDSVVVIQNYPTDKALYQRGDKLSICLTTKFYMTEIGLTLGIRIFDSLILEFAYNPNIFVEKTIKKLSDQYVTVIRQIVEKTGVGLPGNGGIKIKDIQILDQKEKEKIAFNIQEDRKKLNQIEEVNFDEIL